MAPYVPDEVDVFTGPHSRMKYLVNDYVEMLQTTNFSDFADLKLLLDSLRETFREFMLHEQIENTLIMKRLKYKLKKLSIRNKLVCNCHKDTHLTDMLTLVQEGFGKKNDQDRLNYSLQLKKSLELFTEGFLPHMKQEEEIFQPLLLEYFTYEELCELKRKVIDFHSQKGAEVLEKGLREEAEKEEATEDSCSDVEEEEDNECQDVLVPQTSIIDLPPEVMTQIFSYLNPREIGQCSQVCGQWRQSTLNPCLWTEIHPTKWANGDWTARMSDVDYDLEEEEQEDRTQGEFGEGGHRTVIDDDADVDESEAVDSEGALHQSDYTKKVQRQWQILQGMVRYVLPSVGHLVKVLNLGHCHALTNVMLQRLLKLTPNVEYLNLAGTRISDNGLKGLGKNWCGARLRHLNLSGCANVTNISLERVGQALAGGIAECAQPIQLLQGGSGPCWCEVQRLGVAVCEKTNLDPDQDQDTTSTTGSACMDEPEDRSDANGAVGFFFEMFKAEGPGDTDSDDWGVSPHSDSAVLNADDGDAVISGDSRRWADPCHMHCGGEGGGHAANPHSEPDPIEDCARPVCGASIMLQPPGWKITKLTEYPPYYWVVNCATEKPAGCLKDLPFEEDPFTAQDRKPQKLLTYLNLSGCHQLTDYGISALAAAGPLPQLTHLDLSGCLSVTGAGISPLVALCPALKHETLFYCDNIIDGPYADTASGCQNIYCSSRVCCRKGY